jgi:NADH-quinone oxidoreductase subunit L
VAEATLHEHVPLALEWGLIALGSLIALFGVGMAWQWYQQHALAFDKRLRETFGKLYQWASELYHVDDFYRATFVKAVIDGSEKALAPFDQRVVDGIVNGVAKATAGVSRGLRLLQTGIVQTYAVAIVFGVVLVIALMLFG